MGPPRLSWSGEGRFFLFLMTPCLFLVGAAHGQKSPEQGSQRDWPLSPPFPPFLLARSLKAATADAPFFPS